MEHIEVEKKVRLTSSQMREIAKRGQLIEETRIIDRYYDSENYRYTIQNMWLRERKGEFELKVAVQTDSSATDSYEEIIGEKAILQHLSPEKPVTLEEFISQSGLFPFCSLATSRSSYLLDGVRIDIDEVDFEGFCYRIAELEVVVSDRSRLEWAEAKIEKFIREMGIDALLRVPGKLVCFLYLKAPKHYQALVESAVIDPIANDHLEGLLFEKSQ